MAILCSDKLWFVIGLGITLLLCGLIMFYVKQKFSVYDRHIMEQSQLLKHLVNSIQSVTPNVLSSNGSVEQAKKIHEQFNQTTNSRIVVSDDEYSSESDESDSESDMEDSDTDETEDDSNSEYDYLEDKKNENQFVVSKVDDQKINIKQINLVNDGVKLVQVEDLSDVVSKDVFESNDEIMKCSDLECSVNKDVKLVSMKSNDEDDREDELDTNHDNLENVLLKKKYVELSKNQLQELCKEKNLSIKGSKKELIDRLLE